MVSIFREVSHFAMFSYYCNAYCPSRQLESITKPRLSTGSEFCIFNRFPRGHYLVWWVRVRVRVSLGVRVRVRVRVRVSLGVRVRVRVSNLLGSR